MPPIDAKNKILTLRLSANEYYALKTLHQAHGARNVSEFARSAIKKMIAGEPFGVEDSLRAQVNDLNHRVTSLESRLANLAAEGHSANNC